MAVFEDSGTSTTAVFEELESAVRSYCRSWPAVFDRAVGSWLYDESGRGYLDFFCGAGALNYGHNNRRLRAPRPSQLRPRVPAQGFGQGQAREGWRPGPHGLSPDGFRITAGGLNFRLPIRPLNPPFAFPNLHSQDVFRLR